jgi:hypothetical protein
MMRPFGLAVCVVLALSSAAGAQGIQTGTITGIVQSSDGLSLPGVTVTATSPSLQGQRTAVTDVNGVYFVKGLPAGTYSVRFDMASFQNKTTDDVVVTVGGVAEVNTTLTVAGRTETVNVTAEAPSPVAATTLSQAFTKTEVDSLPIGRRPQDIAELAPGLTNNTPNASQVTISGATAFDNVFMLNGVDINDNLFGSPNNLYIEDAVQETNVLTGGISPEWGRFSGGVINVITKSGGNTFSGTLRENFQNPKWIEETPRERANNVVHQNVLGKNTEGTFGGPVMRDRLWFFTAGRYENLPTPNTFVQTGGSYTRVDTNKRGEVKLTGTIGPSQTLAGDFTTNSTIQRDRPSLNTASSLDPSVLVNAKIPNQLFVTTYNGVVRNRFFATLQYSQKRWETSSGGTRTEITASPIRTRGVAVGVPANLHYAAPFFSALDPEQRNNKQFTGSVSRTISTRTIGTHDVKGGGEFYRSSRIGGNSQSATNYVFQTDYLVANGRPMVDSAGVPVPVFTPGVSRVQNWIPTKGAIVNIDTTSAYFQDHWVVAPRLSLDIGTRVEAVRGKATGDLLTVDTTKWVPRLGVAYDLTGNGLTTLQATYGHYSGKYNERQYANNSDVGNPSRVTYGYTGPPGQGRDFAPGFDTRSYATIISASFPTANIFVADGVQSPTVREFTFGLGRKLGRGGYAKATYQWRHWYGFLEDFITLSNGIVNVNRNGADVGDLTKVLYDNADAKDIRREYQGLVLQTSYRVRDNISINGHYTLQIRNHGNFDAEAGNQPGNVSLFGDYPEIYGPALDRYLPFGRLADYQRHKLRLYGTYTLGSNTARFGALDVSPIWRVNSGQVYSLFADGVPLTPIELARNPGYPANDINASTSQRLYFGPRGVGDFKGSGLMDLALSYAVPVWRSAKPWIKVEFYNLLNNQKQIAWDKTVTPDNAGPRDANGLPMNDIQGPRFGQATDDNQFPQPIPGQNGGRLFRVALGVRF